MAAPDPLPGILAGGRRYGKRRSVEGS